MTEDVIVDAETGEIIEPLRAAAQQGSAFDNLPAVVPTNQSVTLFGTDNPVEVIERSSAVASALADLIEQRKLFAVISGRKHVLVEGWTMLGSMLGVFPVMVVQMVATGEESGALDEMLKQVSDYYDSVVEYAVKNLTAMIEPIIILFMGVGAVFLIVAILMPYMTSNLVQLRLRRRLALNYAHQNHVFHCDIKPANILIHVDGRVLLSDFGVARLASETKGGGTPAYMAPEQIVGEEVSASTDVYALGVTIYEMLTGGMLPFRGDSPSSKGSTVQKRIEWEHCNLAIPPIREFNPHVPQSVANVLTKALNKDAGGRYTSTLAFQADFEQARSTQERQTKISETVFQTLVQERPVPGNRTCRPRRE